MKTRNLIRYAIVVAAIVIPVVAFYVWQIFKTPNVNTRSEQDFYLYIPTRSATFETVMDTLKAHELVKDEMSFRLLAKQMKYPQLVKPGRYRIKPNMNNRDVLTMLRAGDQAPLKITFNNVRLKSQLVGKIGNKFEFDSTAFAALLNDPETARFYGFTPETIVAMFLPNTYEIFWNTTPRKLMGRMKSEYDAFWNADRQAKAAALGLTPVEVMTLASIVQGETQKPDEKPRVAGVYLNRLRLGMLLQADPTVIYALQDFGIRRLLFKHLTYDSPYNTYRYKGLPPGPINLPDATSIDAVLNPEQHDYLYFCASPEFNGYHIFARNAQEHAANARLYQQALNQRGNR